jgi:hypothetical protein
LLLNVSGDFWNGSPKSGNFLPLPGLNKNVIGKVELGKNICI